MGYLGRTIGAVGGLGVLLAAACSGDTGSSSADAVEGVASYRQHGVVLGIADERPYGFEEAGKVTGAAPELAREVFSRLGIDVRTYIITDFGFLDDGLLAHRMDVIAAGMYITPERAQDVLFANPDYCSATAFAVEEGNPHGITRFEDLVDAEATLGVLGDAVEVEYAEAAGIPDDRIVTYQETAELFGDLAAGEIQAVALTTFTVRYETEQMDGFDATDSFVAEIEGEEQTGCGAFGFRYEDEALRNAFNEELAAMQEAGEILPVVEPFGFDEEAVEAARDWTANDLTDGAYDTLDG